MPPFRYLMLLSSCFAATALAQTQRLDIQQALATQLCQSSQNPSPQTLWAAQIFDMQMQVARVIADRDISADELQDLALKEAKTLGHRGYAFGFCHKRHAWMISTPAPQALFQRQDRSWLLDASALAASCAYYQLDFAPFDKLFPQQWESKGIDFSKHKLISLPPSDSGTISLTCHPPQPEQHGPEVWAMISVGEIKMPSHIKGIHSHADLMAWIQERRKAAQLPRLQTQKALDTLTSTVQEGGSIKHPRPWLLTQKLSLASQGIKFLGENRVRAKDTETMAWLLWTSPQHRRLLLSPTATWFQAHWERIGDESLLVLWFAAPAPIAKVQGR